MFKVKCKLIKFEGNEKEFPCHFNYKIGDEFHYDGDHFTGRICPGLFASMTPIIHGVFMLGNKFTENVMYRYRGHDIRDPSMAKYDGVGFRPVKKVSDNKGENKKLDYTFNTRTQKAIGHHFLCADSKILAHFSCEAEDLSDSEYAQPFYRREIAILEKIESEPGINITDILGRFTDFERDGISPPLTTVLLEVMLDALYDMKYIDIREGKAFATGKEPPSRPKIG